MNAATSDSFNVCGVVIHARPSRVGDVRNGLATLQGVDIHSETADGRLVVTVMDTDNQTALDQLAAINRIPGVVSATLAYHEIEHPECESGCSCGSGGCGG